MPSSISSESDNFGLRPEWLLVVISIVIISFRIWLFPPQQQELLPKTIYNFELQMSFENPDDDTQIRTFLPDNNERQFVMEETMLSPELVFNDNQTDSGREGRWAAGAASERRLITYRARLSVTGVKFDIPPDLALPLTPPAGNDQYLKETAAIQINSTEISELWEQINPRKSTVLSTLEAIHNFTTNEIESAQFKGYTDALTALRLRQASCNGKSRLFVALARRNNLPARLVGGIILNSGSKKTSHQWLEVKIADQWVPFDPTNNHFASIPKNYLTLYRGDEALFTHSRNINFDYRFTISPKHAIGFETVSPVSGIEPTGWLPRIFENIGLEPAISGALLLFPLAALLISIARNIVGITTFGVFLPMLIGAACRFTGLAVGLIGFGIVVILATALHQPLKRLNLLQIPRLSAMVTIVTTLIIAVIIVTYHQFGMEITMLALFPVIILSFTAERVSTALNQEPLHVLFKDLVSTTLMAISCYLVFNSMLLQGLMLVFPELLLAILGLQIAVGRWTGIRVTELIRFRNLLKSLKKENETFGETQGPLGMNARNRELVQRLNPSKLIATANDKVLTKKLLVSAGVPVPRTLALIHDIWDLQAVRRQLPHWFSFVIKPAQGAKGLGILVISGRDGENFRSAGNKLLNLEDLINHMRIILSGEYSMTGERDEVLIEAMIHPTTFYQNLYTGGLCDIRVILVKGTPLAAMLRVPTIESDGKANLHRGGIGVPIDIETGLTGSGFRHGKRFDTHPDSGNLFAGQQIPNWQKIVEIANMSQATIPLGYIGVDIAEDAAEGPVVLEINARPGLEIQNVNSKGFAEEAFQLAFSDEDIRPETAL